MVDHPPQPADDDKAKAQQRRLVRRLAVAGPLVLGLLVVLLLACVLWIPRRLYPPLTNNDLKDVKTAQNELDAARAQELKDARLKLQNDARTTLLQAVGALLLLTGAGIGASVTLRQVKVSQDGLRATREQMQHTREQMQRTLETTRQQLNLTERGQVTDRYTRAVEQLGHEKAPVRLGALYSLEHLAQDNPEYRQTVVDVICAYLRMPYALPPRNEPAAEQVEEVAPSADGRDRGPMSRAAHDPAQEELQVRRTAQRLLADHLRWPPQTSGQDAQLLPPSPQQAFWPGIGLDLTGATLVDFTLRHTSVRAAVFVEATFQGATWFDEATFQGAAWFDEATFQDDARFARVTFQDDASFARVTFQFAAEFGDATFQGTGWFGDATFQGPAGFGDATFQGTGWFVGTTFQHPWFVGATFQGAAWFLGATFQGTSSFDGVTFQGETSFDGAPFQGIASFDGAHVLHLDEDLGSGRVWPDGWTVRPDPTDPSRGTLVPA